MRTVSKCSSVISIIFGTRIRSGVSERWVDLFPYRLPGGSAEKSYTLTEDLRHEVTRTHVLGFSVLIRVPEDSLYS